MMLSTPPFGNNSHDNRMFPIDETDHDIEEQSYDGAESVATSKHDESDDACSVEALAEKESQMVRFSKIAVCGVLILVAGLIGFLTFRFVRAQEESTFLSKYDTLANEIIDVTHVRARSIFDNLETVSSSLTTYARAVNASWPFVYFKDFQVTGMQSNLITGAHTLTIHPLVYDEKRAEYEEFTQDHFYDWMSEGHMYDESVHPKLYEYNQYNENQETGLRRWQRPWDLTGINPSIWTTPDDSYNYNEPEALPEHAQEVYSPFWQRSPVEDFAAFAGLDLYSVELFTKVIDGMLEMDHPVLTEVTDASFLSLNYDKRFPPQAAEMPHLYLLQPIYDTLFENRTTVGFLSAFLRFGAFFDNILNDEQYGILIVLESSCGQQFSYQLKGRDAHFMGKADLHDTHYDGQLKEFDIVPFAKLEETEERKYCQYRAKIFPSDDYRDQFLSENPIIYAALIVSAFLVTALVFTVYDIMVTRRQKAMMDTATKTNAIVSSLFPKTVRERMMEELENTAAPKKEKAQASKEAFKLMNESSASNAGDTVATSEAIFGSKPIADLFPSTTIMFADLVGFTSWSSVREPTHVFTLLETIYHSFDEIAKRRRVFKVETVGDCYVACCGLPTPNPNHAIVMCRFAEECVMKMNQLLPKLEITLGPDTAELAIRTGLHSGPVTAGVLRGEKGRFQLFGDSMNTASRMESTGIKNKIHLSKQTADILVASGKESWVVPREEKIFAKGKGQLQTFWLRMGADFSASSETKSTTSSSSGAAHKKLQEVGRTETCKKSQKPLIDLEAEHAEKRMERLVHWQVDGLSNSLRQIIARRASSTSRTPSLSRERLRKLPKLLDKHELLKEVKDVLCLPQFDAKTFHNNVDPSTIQLPQNVIQQLTVLVTKIATSYNNENPFHNFEHASHVTMSVTKLLSRIVNPNQVNNDRPDHEVAEQLHDHTFGLTSDPLTQFACILSALVHDVAHPGVPNTTLVKEEDPLAQKFKGKSVAEQNSVVLTWNMLMQPEFEDLRFCIYDNEDEFFRFRSIIVNVVLATDIMDKDLGAARKARWEKAFNMIEKAASPDSPVLDVNRKATIVLEHLIQASDVAHTMQHWHVFRKWNERLFNEMYSAYQTGRIEKNPAEGWYQGELGFFDFYIIPLAKKLETCGVFGVSSHEYLSYAEANRKEWEEKGNEIVEEYLAAIKDRENALEVMKKQQRN